MANRASRLITHAKLAAIPLTLGLIVSALILAIPGPSVPEPGVITVNAADIQDPANLQVLLANVTPTLVHLGTPAPYTGNGAPGLNLQVTASVAVTGWSTQAWVNETAAPPVNVCVNGSIYFATQDWAFQADGGGNDHHGLFLTIPTQQENRLQPDGDQCLTRVGVLGTIHVHYCIDHNPGGPRGIYRDASNAIHFDAWDRCLDADFKVPS